MLKKLKLALRIKTEVYDDELLSLIEAAKLDLSIAGITKNEQEDPLIARAIITYCMMNFGNPGEYDRLKKTYDEQKAQMSNASGYTDWGDL